MKYNLSKELEDIQEWAEYKVGDIEYMLYDTYIIAAVHKFNQLYELFATARMHIIFAEVENFGELIDSSHSISVEFARRAFLIDALYLYNSSIDLSWQVIFLYINIGANDIPDMDIYDKYSEICDYKILLKDLTSCQKMAKHSSQLKELKKLEELEELVKKMWHSDINMELRPLYNYMKHRGYIHSEGLGFNHKNMGFSIDIPQKGVEKIPLFRREEVDIVDLYKNLIELDKLLVKYINNIKEIVVPDNYKDKKKIGIWMPLEYVSKIGVIEGGLRIMSKDEIKKHRKKHGRIN